MAGVYLLDTNVLIAALNGHPLVRERLERMPLSQLRLSAIALGELTFGAEKSAHSERNRARLAAFVERLPLVGVDHQTVFHYSKVRAALERLGTPIGANDTWIAAQALAVGATLVTDNEREFRRVESLVIENWMRG